MSEDTSKVKIYDWNGTLITVEGFRAWVREAHPALAADFYGLDQDVRKAATPDLKRVFEDASNRGLYPCELFPNVAKRLEQDRQEGYARVVFSTVNQDTLDRQMCNFGIRQNIDRIVSLDEVKQDGNLLDAVKEDPRVYGHLVTMLGVARARAYTDDTPARAVAAVTAGVFDKVYLFDPENKAKLGEGYALIDDLMKAA